MRNTINKLFLDHPVSVGESYFQHLVTASTFASRMVIGGIACFIHGVFPFMCTKTGSGIINDLHHAMVSHRTNHVPVEQSDLRVDDGKEIIT